MEICESRIRSSLRVNIHARNPRCLTLVVALAADGRASQSLPAAVLTGHHLLVAPRPAPRGALCWYRSALTGISAAVSADSSIADTTATVAIATVASAAAAVASSTHAHRTRQRQRLR
eukprot:scaffold92297_cov63-Phaeocystis_antarctica.AAC.1